MLDKTKKACYNASMSYDCTIVDLKTGEPVTGVHHHNLAGGTHILGGTNELWFNVTYNYYEHFRIAFGNHDGVRTLHYMNVIQSIPVLELAISHLHGEPDDDYWKATPGNAKQALEGLLKLARMNTNEHAIWDIS